MPLGVAEGASQSALSFGRLAIGSFGHFARETSIESAMLMRTTLGGQGSMLMRVLRRLALR